MRTCILIVDDEYGLAEVIAEMLTEEGHDVALAIDGHLGLAVVHERRVDLVITDVMMPVLTGVELARALKANPATRHIPVIAMTAIPRWRPEEPSLFTAVLLKPFSPEQLGAAIRAALSPSSA
jgi:CheY-like chemotaxis protein